MTDGAVEEAWIGGVASGIGRFSMLSIRASRQAFDRLSRAALSLAKEAADRGAVVLFKPSGKGTDKLMAEAISLAHIVEYSDQRLAGVDGLMRDGSATISRCRLLGTRPEISSPIRAITI